MNKSKAGFMLLEAILTVIIVSICLTFIAQSLLTNFRTGVRFQETVRSLVVMENALGQLYACSASKDQLDAYPKILEKPFDKFTLSTQASTINDHLKNVELKISWPAGSRPGQLEMSTVIYNPNDTFTS